MYMRWSPRVTSKKGVEACVNADCVSGVSQPLWLYLWLAVQVKTGVYRVCQGYEVKCTGFQSTKWGI
jgi:hypothetical protein